MFRLVVCGLLLLPQQLFRGASGALLRSGAPAAAARHRDDNAANEARNATISMSVPVIAMAHGVARRLNSTLNSTQMYRSPEIGASRCIYYSTYENDYISKVYTISGPVPLSQAPADPNVWGLPARGDCWLVLDTNSNYKSDDDHKNLRLAELAVCGLHTKPASCGQFCKVVLRVPLPNNNMDRDSIASCIALAAASKISNTHVNHNNFATIGGLQTTGNGVQLASFTTVSGIINQKLTYAYTNGYTDVIIPQADAAVYQQTEFYNKMLHDPTFLQHAFTVHTCRTMQEVVGLAFV